VGEEDKVSCAESVGQQPDASSDKGVDGQQASSDTPDSAATPAENGSQKEELPASEETRIHRVQLWSTIRSSLNTIEDMMSIRVKKKTGSVNDEKNKKGVVKDELLTETEPLSLTDGAKSPKGACEEDSDEEFYDVERSDPSSDTPLVDGLSTSTNGIAAAAAAPLEALCPWKEELEVLVRGGVPMALRGEVPIILYIYIYIYI